MWIYMLIATVNYFIFRECDDAEKWDLSNKMKSMKGYVFKSNKVYMTKSINEKYYKD